MGISVLGPTALDDGAALGPRDRVVLAALAVRPGAVVAPDQLADALWGDSPPASWSKVVQGCVVRLRKRLGTEAIETRPDGYRLAVPADAIDVQRFERLVQRGRHLSLVGEPERAAFLFAEGLALWRGAPFPELEGWPSGRIEAERLEELRLDVEEAHVDAALAAGRHREVLADVTAMVAAAPLREHRWALLARAQYQSGRQGEALGTLHRARQALLDHLGVDPGPELAALEHAVLRQDPSLVVADPEPQSDTCPYLGLVPYDVGDAEGFFGRDADVAACLQRLQDTGTVVVVGPSGSGKSSLIRAGVAAALRRAGGEVVVVTPGAVPTAGLAALAATERLPTLVVDQCEEAVTLCSDPDERQRFFAALAAHAGRAPLVVAVRADHLGGITADPAFARIVERSIHLLGGMGEAQLRTAIEGPARQAGLVLEEGLVDLLVREVEDEPGALPLLSHALHETWQRREGRTLTVAGYRESGGIRQAVGRSAEELYDGLEPDQRRVLRDLLLRLVSPTGDGEPVRCRVPSSALLSSPARAALVELFVSARLVTSDDGVIQLAHEAIVRAWPRMREWLDEDVEGQRILRHLGAAATAWDAMGRPPSELYRGVRLAAAVDWRDRDRPDLTPLEAAFLDVSAAAEAEGLEAAHTQIRRERRTVRRLRTLVAAVAALALLAAGVSALAVGERRRADDRTLVADARRIATEALLEPSYDRALLLALEGVRAWDHPEMWGNLVTTIGRSPTALAVDRSVGTQLVELQVSPGGRYAAVADNVDDVTVVDLARRRTVASLGGDDGTSYRVPVFSPDGGHLAVSRFATSCWVSECPTFAVEVRAADDLASAEVYEGLGLPAAGIAFSSDGTLLAAAQPFEFSTPTDNIAIWRRGSPEAPLRRLTLEHRGIDLRPTPESGPAGWVAFSPDGALLYASGAGPVVAFDLATGRPVRTFDGLGALALSPDGRILAARTSMADVGLFDATSGKLVAELVGHAGAITAASFSPSGDAVATAGADGTAIVWDVATGEQREVLSGHAGGVTGLGFSPDGSLLSTASTDRTVMTWDVTRQRGLVRQISPPRLPGALRGVLVAPGGHGAAFLEDRMQLLAPDADDLVEATPPDGDVYLWAAYLPDAERVAAVTSRGGTALLDPDTGDTIAQRQGRGRANNGAIAVAPDGETVVVADVDGVVTELDASTLEPTGRTVETSVAAQGIRITHGGIVAVMSSNLAGDGSEVVFADLDAGRVVGRVPYPSWGGRASFSPDGTRYAVGGADGRLLVFEVGDGEVAAGQDPVHEGPSSWVTFSPDGRTVASIGFDGELVLASAETARVQARIRVRGPNTAAAAMAFRDDGHTLVVAYGDGSVHTYDTDPAAWAAHACAVAGRQLTASEWPAELGDRRGTKACRT